MADLPTSFHVVTKQAEPQVYTPETEPRLHLDKGDPDVMLRMIPQTVLRLEDLYQRYGGGFGQGYGDAPVALHVYEIPAG